MLNIARGGGLPRWRCPRASRTWLARSFPLSMVPRSSEGRSRPRRDFPRPGSRHKALLALEPTPPLVKHVFVVRRCESTNLVWGVTSLSLRDLWQRSSFCGPSPRSATLGRRAGGGRLIGKDLGDGPRSTSTSRKDVLALWHSSGTSGPPSNTTADFSAQRQLGLGARLRQRPIEELGAQRALQALVRSAARS